MTQQTETTSPVARLMRASTLWWLAGLIIIVTLVFRRVPALDLETANLFFNDGFQAAHNPVLKSIRHLSIMLTTLLVSSLLLLWIFRLCRPGTNLKFPFSKLAFSTVSLLLGPVLLTNLILKGNWGRPRPKHLEVFGGNSTHVLPFDLSDQCISNCSLPSGETSSAIWLFTLIPLLPVIWHRRALWAVAFYTLVISTLRLSFGGHFLSDVLLSVLLNMAVFWSVWGLFFMRCETIIPLNWANETRTAGPLRRLGKPLVSLSYKAVLAYSALMDKVRRKS